MARYQLRNNNNNNNNNESVENNKNQMLHFVQCLNAVL